MALRPLDMQINIMKESDNAKNAQKERIHEEGQNRFTPQIQKEQDEKNEGVQNLEKTNLENINDRNRGGGEYSGGKGEKRKKEEEKPARPVVKDPDRGGLLDIKS